MMSYLPVREFCTSIVFPSFMVYLGGGYPFALHIRVASVPCTTASLGVPVVKVAAVGASDIGMK